MQVAGANRRPLIIDKHQLAVNVHAVPLAIGADSGKPGDGDILMGSQGREIIEPGLRLMPDGLRFTRALAVALGGHGITVNAIAPGLTRTPGSAAGNPETHFEDVRLAQAVKRSTEPADLAGSVSYLASDDAAMVTGQVIRVDGGLVTL